MSGQTQLGTQGLLDARYHAYLATVAHLRPLPHRYCTRLPRLLLAAAGRILGQGDGHGLNCWRSKCAAPGTCIARGLRWS